MRNIRKILVPLALIGFALVTLCVPASGQRCGVAAKPDCGDPPRKRTAPTRDPGELRRAAEARKKAKAAEGNRRRRVWEGAPLTAQQRAAKFLSKGKEYRDKFEYSLAVSNFTKAIEANPNLSEAYYCRGKAKTELNDIDGAFADYTEAIRIDPKYTEAYNNRGALYLRDMNLDAAIKDFDSAITCFPYDIEVATIYTNRGNAYRFIGSPKAAIADFDKAIESDEKFFKAWLYSGLTNIKEKNFNAAREDCEKALELEPNNSEAKKCRDDIIDAQAKYAAKLERLAGEIEKDKDDPVRYFDRGNAYIENNNFIDAIEDYDKAIALNQNYAFAYAARGTAYYIKKDYTQAISDFTEAIKLNPGFPDPYSKRGLAHFSNGDLDAAIADYTYALESLPWKNPEVYAKRAEVYVGKGLYEDALKDLTKYIGVHPEFFEAYRKRASVYDLMGKPELANADRKTAKGKN